MRSFETDGGETIMGEKKTESLTVIPAERIESAIYLIRGQKVLFDKDLAVLYGVETFNPNKTVKRNIERFPSDFMIQLTKDEWERLKFQTGMSKPQGRGGRRPTPFTFMEQGVAMLSSVLRSRCACQVNVEIMRAFVRLRRMLATHEHLARKLTGLEMRYDRQLKVLFTAIRELKASRDELNKKRTIVFHSRSNE